MHAMLNVAVMAARRGGDTLIRNMNKLEKLNVEQKGRNDFVSDADYAAEKAVIETILKHYPDHAILAEESGQTGESDYVWIIDPLDGTTNYLHRFPVYCVSVALAHNGRLEHGAVYDPLRQEFFTATRGQGAQLEGHKIRVSGRIDLERALIGTGFPYRDSNEAFEPYMNMLVSAMKNTTGIRRAGSAALDLCYVAAGRLDAYWETGLKPWDLAAGTLIVREAGGIVSGLDGSEEFMDNGHVLCGSPKIYAALAKLFGPDIKAMFAA
ncbi:MAG: inositol monophosphatase family protein [Proteobacteria bacterium]|nr:inositol monophosphatase family protein [Pseudomonadota bacterium]